ncbi:hypothetical protein ABL78_1326 [Leptomonas seymouri]|uniref:Uncharacterized protein n=1 Tax=Leptomonas seymouri TaxID=5684 RepID=A0A0N1IAT9_LEPSE|nr:hypothetical protein ABL78_1326 [Leptomonas seymouri]|eukprot:KPI89558.1 hypothetical protein ABL78_1326 [Leptomonas seymouri]
MARKQRQRNASASSAHTADAAEPSQALLAASTTAMTAQETLHSVLERLDAIAQEAHVYTQQMKHAELHCVSSPEVATAAASSSSSSTAKAHKRPRDGEASSIGEQSKAQVRSDASPSSSRLDVFAVTSALQYQALCTAVAAFGLQLLPSLEDIAKRVTLAVLTPALSTPEAWEALAMLCATYRAGMAQAVNEVLESLLRESGVLLLDAPQLVPAWYAETYVHVLPSGCAANTATAALGGLLAFVEDQRMRDASSESSPTLRLARVYTDRVARKLRALVDILYAVGEYVPSSTLQQVALRHVMEVVEGGLLPCYWSASEAGEETVATFKTEAATAATSSGSAQRVLRWRVPPAWHAVCLQLLEAFILTIRPVVPAQLLVSASHVMNVVSGRLHRGVPVLSHEDPSSRSESSGGKEAAMEHQFAVPLPVSHAVNAAVVRLGHVLYLLRHPVVLAPYQPPQLTLEKAKWRVWSVDTETAASTAVADVSVDVASTPASAVAEHTQAPVQAAAPAVHAQAPPTLAAAAATSTAQSMPISAPAVERKQPVVKPAPAAQPTAAPAAPPQQQQPAPAAKVALQRNAEEEEDDIPDVVLDD